MIIVIIDDDYHYRSGNDNHYRPGNDNHYQSKNCQNILTIPASPSPVAQFPCDISFHETLVSMRR